MAPKNLPSAAKQAKILEWFRETMSVYSLKELEKLLPSVGSIHQVQVKDFLQNLTDENLVRVEKIGSGNWYWSFGSDAKRAKENILNNLQTEESKVMASIDELDRWIDGETAKLEEDEGMLERNGMDRKVILDTHGDLTKELEALDRALGDYSDNDPAEVLKKKEEALRLKDDATRWTDHLESMECYLNHKVGDRFQIAKMMQSWCDGEYTAGEGLMEI